MRQISDEMLMAYADGALFGDGRRAVESLIRRDLHARNQVLMFRRAARYAKAAFAEIEFETVRLEVADLPLRQERPR